MLRPRKPLKLGRLAMIVVLMAPIAMPAGAVVCLDAHGRIAIEFADATTGRCAGHGHDHCHASGEIQPEAMDSCCSPEPSSEGPIVAHADDHGCVDLQVESDLNRHDQLAAADLAIPVAALEFVIPEPACFASVAVVPVGHAPPWVRPALETFVILT